MSYHRSSHNGRKRSPPGFDAERLAIGLGMRVEKTLNGLAGLREQSEAGAHQHYSSLSRAAREPQMSCWARALSRIPALARLGVPRSELEICPLAVKQVLAASYMDGPLPAVEEMLNGHAREDVDVQITLTEALADEHFSPEEKLRVAEEMEEEAAAALACARTLRQEATAAGVEG